MYRLQTATRCATEIVHASCHFEYVAFVMASWAMSPRMFSDSLLCYININHTSAK